MTNWRFWGPLLLPNTKFLIATEKGMDVESYGNGMRQTQKT